MRKTLEVINELKNEGIIQEYAIGGAVGVLKWVEPLFTRDLDIFIVVKRDRERKIVDLTPLYYFLKRRGYKEWIGQWIMIEGIPVEFIVADELGEEAVLDAAEFEYEGVECRVIKPEYLIALLLQAGRNKDKIKIDMLLKEADIDKLKLEKILQKYKLKLECLRK